MGKGGQAVAKLGKGGQAVSLTQYSREEVEQHTNWKKKDAWIVYRGLVYDISNFGRRHPGGNVVTLYSGQDATTSMERMHKDHDLLDKWLKPLLLGECKELGKKTTLEEDFDALTAELEAEGRFTSNKWFYLGMLGHIVVLEILAWYYVYKGGLDWGGSFGYWGLCFVLCIAQAQSGWLQHDFGHFSVFEGYWPNYIAHQFTIAHLKAASKHWWQSRHHRHHAKPNVILKDPDIDATLPMFMFGEAYFDAGRYYFDKVIPYQKYLWFVFGPPMVTTVLFVVQTIYYMIARKKGWDLLWVLTYFIRFGFTFGPYLGWGGCFKLYFCTRVIETQWFTWITSMSHLPMPCHADEDAPSDWFSLQVGTTQNVEPGWFNDWFSGHLNYQIEHHLWPTMPRHHYSKVCKRVEALCHKHGFDYRSRTMFQACCDIVDKLDVVAEAYDEWLEMSPSKQKLQRYMDKKNKKKLS